MDAEETLFRKRLTELAVKSYNNSQYLFTNFLSMAEQNTYFSMERELSYVPVTLFGGTGDCERVMLRFGSEELCGYEEAFPIVCMKIEPVIEKFGEQLSHRDYLGALINLGVDRATLGDIIIVEKTAYLFCTEKMAPYLLENLTQVKHTHVKCTITTDFPSSTITRLERSSGIAKNKSRFHMVPVVRSVVLAIIILHPPQSFNFLSFSCFYAVRKTDIQGPLISWLLS